MATLLPLTGLGVYWILREIREERLRVQHEAEMEAEGIADLAARRVAAVREMLATLARLPAVRAGDLSAARLSPGDGRQVSAQAGREEAGRLFRDLLAHSPDLENMGLINPDGSVVVSAIVVPPAQRITVQDRDWFQQALLSGRPAVGGFQIGRITGTPNVIVAHPVLDDVGQVTAVITAVLRLAAVSQEVTGGHLPDHLRDHLGHAPSVIWAVVDGQGLTLLHSDVRAAFGPLWTFPPGMLRAEAVVPGTPWRAVAAIPEAVVTARVRQLLLLIGLPASAILLLAVTLGLWTARNTWRPLQELAAAVRRIGAGQPDVRIPAGAWGEVGEVATAFAETLETLAAREADLRRRGEEVGALLRATRTVMAGLDLQEIIGRIVGEAAQIAGTPHAKVLLVDRDAQVLRLGAVAGRPSAMLEGLRLPLGTGLSGIVAASGQLLYVPECQHDPRNVYTDQDRELGLVTYLGLPIMIRGEVVGVLTFNTTHPRQYSTDELAYLASFAAQAAIAIQNARLYQEIQQHATTLEARVRERTAELEKALRVKAQFLANMSHELRTPLNAVLGFSEVLLGRGPGDLTAKQERYLQQVHTGGKRLLELVTGLLEMAAADSGPVDFHLERLAVEGLVDEVLASLAAVARVRSVALETSLDPGLPMVVADRRKLAQVLHHLVANALRFTPNGGRVTVTARRVSGTRGQGPGTDSEPPTPDPGSQTSATGEWLELAVADTGIGIRPEDLARIFEAFEQVDGSDTRPYGGAGLGLALVRRLVELHGGRVWAESEGEGRGARFIVRLPRLENPRPNRILVVEDEASVLHALCVALAGAGYAVERAHSGTQALAALATSPPDLLVLDIGLPDVDGWSVLKQVRGEERTRDLPVLVLTGLDYVHADQALALGAHEFLAKPVSPRVLAETVRRLLARPATVSAPGGPPPIEE